MGGGKGRNTFFFLAHTKSSYTGSHLVNFIGSVTRLGHISDDAEIQLPDKINLSSFQLLSDLASVAF